MAKTDRKRVIKSLPTRCVVITGAVLVPKAKKAKPYVRTEKRSGLWGDSPTTLRIPRFVTRGIA